MNLNAVKDNVREVCAENDITTLSEDVINSITRRILSGKVPTSTSGSSSSSSGGSSTGSSNSSSEAMSEEEEFEESSSGSDYQLVENKKRKPLKDAQPKKSSTQKKNKIADPRTSSNYYQVLNQQENHKSYETEDDACRNLMNINVTIDKYLVDLSCK